MQLSQRQDLNINRLSVSEPWWGMVHGVKDQMRTEDFRVPLILFNARTRALPVTAAGLLNLDRWHIVAAGRRLQSVTADFVVL